jgi:hypothetical protein
MIKESDKSLAFLRERLHYDPITGIFVSTNLKSRFFGKQVGSIGSGGYVRLTFTIGNKTVYWLAHRVAWAFYYGKWPDKFIDHKDKDKVNNAILNLRDVDKSTNVYNYSREGKNSSGFRGVFPDYRGDSPRFNAAYGRKHLGTFSTPEEASNCYLAYVASIHDVIVED